MFQAPATARVHNYLNDAAKESIEQWAGEAGITDIEIVSLDPI